MGSQRFIYKTPGQRPVLYYYLYLSIYKNVIIHVMLTYIHVILRLVVSFDTLRL